MAHGAPRWLAPAGVFLATFVLFAPSFVAWFAVLDFNHLDAIRTTDASTYFLRIFDPSDGGRSLFGTGDLYRPIYYTAFWLEYQAFGVHPMPYYVLNATLHAANAVLVWMLAWRLTRSDLASVAGALIWSFHPQYADAVAWVSSTTDLLLVSFGLSAVLLYAHALEATGRRRRLSYGASLAAALLALGAKEAGIALVPIIVGYHLLLGQPDSLHQRRIPWALLPFLLIPAVYLPLRAALVGNLAFEQGSTNLGVDVFRNIHRLSGLAAGPLVGQTVSDVSYGVVQGAAGMVVIGATIVAVLWGGRREWFLAGWYYVALGPFLVLGPFWLVGRYLYLAWVGIAILAGIGIARAFQSAPLSRAIPVVRDGAAAALLIGVMVWFGLLNAGYQDWLTDKGEDAKAFLAALETTYPTLPEGARLIVTEYPSSLSLLPDDGMMLRPAVRVSYGQDVDVITMSQIDSGDAPPPRPTDLWYPPRSPGIP